MQLTPNHCKICRFEQISLPLCNNVSKRAEKRTRKSPGKTRKLAGKTRKLADSCLHVFLLLIKINLISRLEKNHEAILSHSLCAQKMSERLQSRAWSCSTLQAGLQLASDLPMSLSAFGDDDVAAMERELAQLKVSSWGWGKIKPQIQIAIHFF